MSGLLGMGMQPGLLSGSPYKDPALDALLGQVRALPAPRPVAPPQRERVSGWRVFDRVLGGQTVSEGLDAERARLTAEADAPRQRMLREQTLAAIRDPRERALFLSLGGEDWQKNVGQQFAPQVVAAGAAQVVNGRRTVDQPSFTESGDTILSRSASGVTPVYTRTTPSISEATAQYGAETGRMGVETTARKANMDYQVQQEQLDINRDRLTLDEQAAGYTLAPNGQRYDRFGNLVAQGVAPPRAASPADNEDRAAIEGYRAVNDRFNRLLTSISGDPERGVQPEFNLTPLAAAGYKVALRTGIGMSPEAAAYGDYVSEIKSAVSDALRLNTGPQTDQDAIREAEALLLNIDNGDYVRRRLPTVIANNNRLASGRQTLMQQRGSAAPMAAAAPVASGSTPVVNQSQYQALPSGSMFIAEGDPTRQVRRKP